MKHLQKRCFKWCGLLIAFLGFVGVVEAQVTLNFDGLASGIDYILIPGGYGNLQWNNFAAFNGANQLATEGYHNGMISPNNVAFNLFGGPAYIQRSSIFHLDSAYLTAAFQPDLEVRVEGFIGTNLVYSDAYILNPAAPVLVQFNHAGVDKVCFTASPESQFVMDDLTFTPEVTNACAYAINPADGVYSFETQTGIVSVITSAGCPWTVENSNAWITILSATTNSDNATVSYLVQSNSTGFPRSGYINIAGQLFAVTQSPTDLSGGNPVNLGDVEVSQIGHEFVTKHPGMRFPFPNLVRDYLIDQDQHSGGGGILPPVTVDWNTNHQFTLSVSAPAGKMFLLQVPSGESVMFSGFLWWQSGGGGFSPPGTAKVSFLGLQGTTPDFSQSYSVLSDSHGFFGFGNIDSAPFTRGIAFTSIVITGTAAPQYAPDGGLLFAAHSESSLQIVCTASGLTDPGSVLAIVPQTTMASSGSILAPQLTGAIDENGDLTLSFSGTLQSAASPGGPFNDVPGHPLRTYSVPKASLSLQQFFRARDIY